MFQDIIRDTEIYQYIMQEGREQEKQQTLQQLRQTLIAFVQARSLELVPLAQKKVEGINSVEMLNTLVLNIGLAQNAEEVRRYLEEVEDK